MRMKLDKQTECAIGRIEDRLVELEHMLRPTTSVAHDLLEAKRAQHELGLAVLWIAVNPDTGILEHKFVGRDEIEKYLGLRYKKALDALRDTQIGEALYIDGAFFMKVQAPHREPMNVKHYTSGGN